MSVWVWISHNKEWLFSGAGLLAVTGISKLLTRKPVSAPPTTDLPSVSTQAVSVAPVQTVMQSPVINVSPSFNISTESAHHKGKAKRGSSGIPGVSPANEVNEDPRPRLYSLTPRITRVSEKREDAGEGEAYGLIEGGDVLQAVVATFRMRKPPEDGQDVYVTARLSYKTVEEIAGREIKTEVRRINYATWLEEDFNSVEMTLSDTKELVLLLSAGGKYIAVQDNRHSLERYKPLSLHELTFVYDGIYIDVTLVDRNHGNLILYTYKVEPDPLKVHEIICVPRV
jgi:hypothetical protein